jgi:hypothetical protein
MPTLHRIGACLIRMYFEDHGVPHVHVEHGESKATVAIETGEIMAGRLPRRGGPAALAWIAAHRAELLAKWRVLQGSDR